MRASPKLSLLCYFWNAGALSTNHLILQNKLPTMSVFGGSLELESQPRLRSVWNSRTGLHDEVSVQLREAYLQDIHEGDRIGYGFNWKLGMTTKYLPNDTKTIVSDKDDTVNDGNSTDSTATIAKRQVIGAERVIRGPRYQFLYSSLPPLFVSPRLSSRLSAPHRTHSSPHNIPASNLTARLSNPSQLLQMTSPRSSGQLRTLYASRRARGVSLADGQGFLYAFVDHGHLWKIGMSHNYDRRRAEWDRQCLCFDRIWLPPLRVLRRRRSESLAHILLELSLYSIQVEGVTLRNLSSSEAGDAFGEGKFGQCLCAAHLHKESR
ncbi:MAG: hypothetical protein NXY57DRAFT_959814 [Lentinula lateritia]|nr:MAG: hypothetical protein NXY57DRAFT_959814 [Lentinula lateritia]